jgi:hypothetical protein
MCPFISDPLWGERHKQRERRKKDVALAACLTMACASLIRRAKKAWTNKTTQNNRKPNAQNKEVTHFKPSHGKDTVWYPNYF